MSKKFLAGFLSIAMVLSQARVFDANAYAADTIGTTNTTNKGFSKTTKAALEIGSGLLTVIGIPAIAWGVCKYRENATERIMSWVIDSKNNPPAGLSEGAVDHRIYSQCHQKGLSPESVFVHVSEGRGNVAVCYYGKDAFRNCIADAENDDLMNGEFGVSYAHSTQVIWYDSAVNKYMYGKPDHEFNIQENVKRFVEFGDGIYEAEYRNVNSEGEAPDWRLVITDLTQQDGSGRNKRIGTLVETDTGDFEFHVQDATGDRNWGSYSKSIHLIKEFCLNPLVCGLM